MTASDVGSRLKFPSEISGRKSLGDSVRDLIPATEVTGLVIPLGTPFVPAPICPLLQGLFFSSQALHGGPLQDRSCITAICPPWSASAWPADLLLSVEKLRAASTAVCRITAAVLLRLHFRTSAWPAPPRSRPRLSRPPGHSLAGTAAACQPPCRQAARLLT